MERLKPHTVKNGLILLCALLLSSNHPGYVCGSGDFADFSENRPELTTEHIAKFYTENRIDGNENSEKCSDRVLEFRKRYQAGHGNMNKTLGVEPTVGLGAALLIFVMVGVFAAGIAQAFQMVSYVVRQLKILEMLI